MCTSDTKDMLQWEWDVRGCVPIILVTKRDNCYIIKSVHLCKVYGHATMIACDCHGNCLSGSPMRPNVPEPSASLAKPIEAPKR